MKKTGIVFFLLGNCIMLWGYTPLFIQYLTVENYFKEGYILIIPILSSAVLFFISFIFFVLHIFLEKTYSFIKDLLALGLIVFTHSTSLGRTMLEKPFIGVAISLFAIFYSVRLWLKK